MAAAVNSSPTATSPNSNAFASTIAALMLTPNSLSGSLSPLTPARSLSSTSVGFMLLNDARSAARLTNSRDISADVSVVISIARNRLPNTPTAPRASFFDIPRAVAEFSPNASTRSDWSSNTTPTFEMVSARSLAGPTVAAPSPISAPASVATMATIAVKTPSVTLRVVPRPLAMVPRVFSPLAEVFDLSPRSSTAEAACLLSLCKSFRFFSVSDNSRDILLSVSVSRFKRISKSCAARLFSPFSALMRSYSLRVASTF